MPDKVPLIKAGEMKDGQIYLKTNVARAISERFYYHKENFKMLIEPTEEMQPETFGWFKILRVDDTDQKETQDGLNQTTEEAGK